jgi:uncharacterized protein (TIGR02246 family)
VNPAADRRGVEEATARLLDAVNSANVGQVIALWAEDGVLMPPNHPAVHGRDAIEKYFRDLFQRARFQFVFSASSIHIDKDTAIELVHYSAEAWLSGSSTPVADRGKGVHVYRRDARETWRLAMDIWNTDMPRAS